MMTVGIDGRELAAGLRTGIGRYVIEVLRAASEGGWRCIVYGDRATTLEDPLPAITLRRLNGGWTQWWDQVTLPRQLARDRITVFLSPYYKGPVFAPCPVILTIHDLFFIDYPGQRRPLYDVGMTCLARLYAQRATAIIADSQYSKRAIVERLTIDAEKITVIPVPLGREFREESLTDEVKRRYGICEPYILYLGAFKPHKNVPCLLRAFAGLPASIRDAHHLVLAGGDPRAPLERLAAELGMAELVHFPGPIADQDLPALYSGCMLFVFPSLEEGFGLPALEAMACGAPVIASNRAAIPEVVGDAALLFEPEDVPAFTKAMTMVLSEPELRELFRHRGRARAAEFTRDRTAGRVLALCRAVGSGRWGDPR